jgi:O-antigen ligase
MPAGGSETWYDRAHSIYLDYLVETGIFGFLAFVSVFVAYYVQFAKKNKELDGIQEKNKSEKNKLIFERGLFFALPIAYLMQGIVLFDILPTYINLFLFLSFAVWKFQLSSGEQVKRTK